MGACFVQKTETLLRFLGNTTDLPVFCWDGTPQLLQELEKRYCFSTQAQPLLTAWGSHLVLESMKPSTLYEAEDPLGVHFFSFLFGGKPVWAGPFVVKEWDDLSAEERLMKAGLPASYFSPYKLYYCSLNLMSPSVTAKIITGAVLTLLPDEPAYVYRNLTSLTDRKLPDLYTRDPLNLENAMRQYEMENRFLSLIEQGRTEDALAAWERLGQIPSSKELAVPGLQSMIANATSLRTLTRKAAERGGVHPVTVDTISVAYAQKMYTARTRSELTKMLPGMIREFADAVHEAQQMHYSLAVTFAVNYLRLHISQEIDIKKMAEFAGCAPGYLGKLFKKETGMTIAQFVAQERCSTAANLLTHTNLPVQDISAHVGYLDSNYFVKVFKSCKGKTPTAYRNQYHS